MAKEEVMDVVEETLDVIDDTLETLERIPKVHLNGTTKAQQIVILSVTFTVGAAVGAGVAYKVLDKKFKLKYEKIAEQEIAEAKVFYSKLNKTGDYSDPEKLAKEVLDEVVEEIDEYADAVKDYTSPENPTAVRVTAVQVEVEQETAQEVEERNIFVDNRDPDNLFDLAAEVAKRDPLVPYIITDEEFLQNDPEHEQLSLVYYEGDKTLADDKDGEVPEPDVTVGETHLALFGHGSNDANIVYVRNEKLNMDFEIARSPGHYAHEVLGLQHSDMTGSRRRENYQRRTGNRRFRDGDDE